MYYEIIVHVELKHKRRKMSAGKLTVVHVNYRSEKPKVLKMRGDTYNNIKSYMCSVGSVTSRGIFFVPNPNGIGRVELPYDQLNQPVEYSEIYYDEFVGRPPKEPGYKTEELIKAVDYNRTDDVLKLLEEGADVSVDGNPLITAIDKNNPVILRALLEAGMPLFFTVSIFSGELIVRADVLKENSAHVEITELLIKAGVDYNTISLTKAIQKKNYFLLSFLLKNATPRMGVGNMMNSVLYGELFSVQVNRLDNDLNTVLHYAANVGDLVAVSMILGSRIVDKTIRNRYGKTAEDISREKRYLEIADLISSS